MASKPHSQKSETIRLNPDDITLEMRLSDTRQLHKGTIVEVAAFVLLHSEENPATPASLSEEIGMPIGRANGGIRFLVETGYVGHDHARMTRKGITGPRIFPTESLVELANDEKPTFAALDNEIVIRDIRLETYETRDQVVSRALAALRIIDAVTDTPDGPGELSTGPSHPSDNS